jgi:HK97 gp10 family phage protein
MRSTVAVGPGEPVHLRDEIRQVEPGGITMGDAYWWRFLEHGTVHMSPQPFIKPAMKRIRTPARKDAVQRAIDLMKRGAV